MAPPPPPSSSAAATTSVQVALRIRPTTTQDAISIPARFQRTIIHTTGPTSVTVEASTAAPSAAGAATTAGTVTAAGKKQVFAFDQVHPPSITQHALFTSTAEPLVARFIEGFNCTILAYGQTSSGKTYTMTGIDLDADPSNSSNGMGIIPRAVSTIFLRARKLKEERAGAWNYSIKGSFVELYNEDLLDLLSIDDTSGGRREVQIREDKDGHIIWGGLREVQVKNAGEVMNLIRQGTSIRRTNETDMNAQSSRSHAIFSLTLTQKKYNGLGAGPPTRSSSPLPPGGRSPSRLARPGSMMQQHSSGRVSSPTFGRPSTPSFASGIGRGGLRPASAMGLRPPERRDSVTADGGDEPGEWTTVVSKFHFVDLAGSERLKRTAAAGERIKEGISINSGLLALGNVISALGDPSRAKSHTATHVPYRDSKLTRLLQDSLGGNAHTLMIACVSPAEWNAGETVNTLKYANRARNIKNRAVVNEKEDGWDDVEWLQGTVLRLRRDLKLIKEGGGGGNGTIHEAPEELQGAGKKVLAQMTDLQNNYEDLREKFVERTEELTRLRRELGVKQRGSTGGALAGTAKYEEIVGPVIEEYEKTIGAMEAELSLNRAALRHTNEMVEEKEEELAVITERHATTELYVEDLRARVAKLGERESSTEAYVRDLEEKIKSYDETSITSNESMTDLKREVARYKDTESYSGKYIADLEARLARADESVLALQQTVEKLEKESDRRREEVEVLQTRLENLKSDGSSWRTDLEQRERKVMELELKMVEWERKRKEAGEERLRLGSVVGEVALARRSLESMATDTDTNGTSTPVSGTSTPNKVDLSLESQLVTLQQTHTATLADLSSVTSKYRDALREISDLAAQIQEAKLSNPAAPSPLTPTFPSHDIQSLTRRMTGGRSREGSEPQVNGQSRRLFYRAASTDSLHSRSLSQSQSLSQELSSARSRKASTSSHGTSGSMSHSPSSRSKPNLSISLSAAAINPNERSVTSLEKEIMRLQEVLHQREAEITILESSLKEKERMPSSSPLPMTAEERLEAVDIDSHLSPKTMNKFDEIRRSMALPNGHAEPKEESIPDSDASLQRLNELMLSMAQKESQHREVVDELTAQLSQVQRQHDELTALSRDQALNMSTELEALRSKHDHDIIKLEQVLQREAELTKALTKAEADHAAAVEGLRAEHEKAILAKEAEIDELLARTKEEHGMAVNALNEQLSQASTALEKAHQEHTEAFGKLAADHEEELQRRIQEANDVLERTTNEHEESLKQVKVEHGEAVKQKSEEASAALQHTEEEYYNLLAKLRSDHCEALEKQKTEVAATLERLREEHAGELRMAEIAREGSLTESQSSQAAALKDLQDEHAAAIARKEASFTEDLENLRADHARVLATKDEDHRSKRDNLKAEHASTLARLRHESELEIERLTAALKKSQDDAATTSGKVKEGHEATVQALHEKHVSILQEVEHGHQDELTKLRSIHDDATKDADAKAEQVRSSLAQYHTEEMVKIKAEHQAASAEASANLLAAQEQHRQDLEEARSQREHLVTQHNETLASSLAELEQQHSTEREKLRKDHNLLVQQLESHKTAADKSKAQSEKLLAEERAQSAVAFADLDKKHSAECNVLRGDREQLAQEFASYKSAAEEVATGHELVLGTHKNALNDKTMVIAKMEQQLSGVQSERTDLQADVAKLRAELKTTRADKAKLAQEVSKRESLAGELERHRSVLADVQENLQRIRDEKDSIQTQKVKQDTMVRDLQAQLARQSSSSNAPAAVDRNLSYTRANGLPPMKLPPPTPPPSAPPPPAPRNGDSISSQSSVVRSSTTSSRESQLDSPATPSTSVAHSLANGQTGSPADAKVSAQLEQQAKHIEEQDAMIKTLNKQLSHCETDLQAHMDLVSTLETSLGDSEKNLRKARMHATELARERDTLTSQIENLRSELQGAKREADIVRRSIAEEKQTLEQRVDEERKAKERARHQLDTRMEELQKRKSKFACL